MRPLLSILIPTTPDREDGVSDLLRKIQSRDAHKQLALHFIDMKGKQQRRYYTSAGGGVEIIVCEDNKELTIGEKRELLYKAATGIFSWQIDSDDSVPDNAVEQIIKAILKNIEVPCITFKEKCLINGEYKSSNHSIKYDRWQDNFDGYNFVRCPFYKDVIRTDIAQSVPFPHIRWNEDEQWSMAIKPLLTSEVHIDEELYHYIYEPKETHQERYGFDKE